MRLGHRRSYLALAFVLTACGGSKPPAEDPSQAEPTGNTATPPPSAASADETEAKPEAEAKPKKGEPAVEPVFTDDMSVEQAIKAIPQDAERMNVDQETLSKPLQEESLYAPCKAGSSHFTFRIAVWRGKAVAIDMTTTPKNPKL